MRFSPSEILPLARARGFNGPVVEKVLCLLHLLNTLNSHPSLKGKWALKGGTALNLFLLNYPRLSVDIDLNYIGALDRDEMLADRPKVEQAAEAVFSREGFAVRMAPTEHAGGKWRLSYPSFTGQSANVDVDLNFMFRRPLWAIGHVDSHPLGFYQAKQIPLLNVHELMAGKLAALLSRRQARDLFDCHQMLHMDVLQRDRLRIAFVVYGGMNRKDWRSVSLEDVDYDGAELARQLRPLLRIPLSREHRTPMEYGEQLVDECKKNLSAVLPFTDNERAFLDQLLDEGRIDAKLLTSDPTLQERIQTQPLLEWKALNIRQHKGLS